jgi:PKHD-type hydroxylase
MKEYTFKKYENDPMNYYVFEHGFNAEELEHIYRGVDYIPFEEAVILGDNNDVRNSRVKWIPQSEEWDWLYEKLISMAEIANQELWGFDLHTAPEMIQYTEYLASERGKYEWHQDIGPGIPAFRKVSITVQLADPSEYEGGNLQLWMGGDITDPENIVECPRGLGNVIIFPSYMPHQVAPITSGLRRSFVLWVGGEHYK